ncbi:MAG: hypothetical protein DHS20C18_29730 [Saprospiraceae bacterium]|nr:MAG: hypothetical protein DHS20C18_29730 [Saprospiraceae bacterium]
MRFNSIPFLFFALWVVLIDCKAAIWLPDVIDDNMVLQRGQPVPIWGQADPGETIQVRFNGQIKKTTTGKNGHWKVSLDPLVANSNPTMMATGKR